jgi:hypothetical protein
VIGELSSEFWWNEICMENQTTVRKSYPSINLPTTNPVWIGPRSNSGLHGEWPVTNRVIHRHGASKRKNLVFWNMTPCRVVNRYQMSASIVRVFLRNFGGIYLYGVMSQETGVVISTAVITTNLAQIQFVSRRY